MRTTHILLGAPGPALVELAQFLRREGFEDPHAVRLLAHASHLPAIGEDPAVTAWETGTPLPPLPPAEEDCPVLFLLPSLADPRSALEAIRAWLELHERELSRILTLVDCEGLAADASHHAYYDLCLHFSDVLLLGRREEVPKKWVQEYQKRLHKLAVPTLIEFAKKGGKVTDPIALLYPEARRVSQFFDPPEETIELPVEIEGFGTEEETDDPRDAALDPYLTRGEDGQYRVRLRL